MKPIDTSGISPSPRVETDRRPGEARTATSDRGVTSPRAPSVLAEDTVELTSTATRLTQLKADVASAEGIDQARVAALREQIANGSYEINPERIADALIKLEQELV